MNLFKSVFIASIVLMLGAGCQKSANRTDPQAGAQGKPSPNETVKSKETCEQTKTFTTVKDGVSAKSETNTTYTTESIDKDIDDKTTESQYKTTFASKNYSVSDDGTKTLIGSQNSIEVGQGTYSIEELEPNIWLSKSEIKGTYKFLNNETQQYETESFDTKTEDKYSNDGNIYYAIYSKENGKDVRIPVGRYRMTKTSEQGGRVKVRTKTLIEPVKDNQPNVERTIETSVRTCRTELVDSVDLALP